MRKNRDKEKLPLLFSDLPVSSQCIISLSPEGSKENASKKQVLKCAKLAQLCILFIFHLDMPEFKNFAVCCKCYFHSHAALVYNDVVIINC